MAYTTINKSTDYFNTKLFTGNGSTTQTITGVGFQPDLVWFKNRSTTNDHNVYDVVRGSSKRLEPNNTLVEADIGSDFTFQSDGFYVGDRGDTNGNGNDIVAWNWKAGGTGSSNTDGSITSTVSANTTAGFSIVSYTGTGANATVGHGLGAVPKMIIIKELNNATNWIVYHTGVGNGGSLQLNTTIATDTDSTFWNSTTPTSSVFTLGSNGNSNGSSDNYIAYCFAEKTGYSKCNSYTGLGGTNYPFIYTGFKPAFVMVKRTNDTSNWVMYDNKRQYNLIEGQYNPQRPRLASNLNSAESSFTSDNGVDLLSNGFVVRDNSNDAYTINISGSTYIYYAVGQSIVGSNNVPCTAR